MTAALINALWPFVMIALVGLLKVYYERANQNLADRDRLNECLKDVIKQFYEHE